MARGPAVADRLRGARLRQEAGARAVEAQVAGADAQPRRLEGVHAEALPLRVVTADQQPVPHPRRPLDQEAARRPSGASAGPLRANSASASASGIAPAHASARASKASSTTPPRAAPAAIPKLAVALIHAPASSGDVASARTAAL